MLPVIVKCPRCEHENMMLSGVGSDTTICGGCNVMLTLMFDGKLHVDGKEAS